MSAVICFACGVLFLGLGIWTSRQRKPVSFYAGIPVKPDSIRDIRGYNRACGRMWLGYSVPWFVAGAAALRLGASMVVFGLILLAAVPGSIWLLVRFNRIQRAYSV